MKNARRMRKGFKLALCTLMALVLMLPVFAQTVFASPYGTTYVFDDGVARMEVSGFIGMTGDVSVSGGWAWEVETLNFRVFMIEESQSFVGTNIYPTAGRYIFQTGALSRFGEMGGFGGSPTEYQIQHFMHPYGVRINRSFFTVGDSLEAVDGYDDWYVFHEPTEWSVLDNVTIVLTPSMADEYLERGFLIDEEVYRRRADFDELDLIYQLQIPGLRELILSARGEQAIAPTPTVEVQPAQPTQPAVQGATSYLRFVLGQTQFTNDGITMTSEVAPFVENGRTMLPLRVIAESLNAVPTWDGATSTAHITRDGITLSLTMGVPLPDDMGTALVIDNRVLVPVRYISEMLGVTVRWDAEHSAIYVYPS